MESFFGPFLANVIMAELGQNIVKSLVIEIICIIAVMLVTRWQLQNLNI